MSVILDELLGIRSMLANCLPQSPTPEDIIEAMEETYQDVTNLGNNTGNAWQMGSYTFATVAGTRTYLIYNSAVVTNVSTIADTVTIQTNSSFAALDPVVFSSSGGMPGGLTRGATYYLPSTYDATVGATQISDTSNGLGLVNITSSGSGLITMSRLGAPDFYKALTVTTVPPDTSTPEYVLEFTEIESLPQEWAWLSQNQGSLLWSSHSSQLIAFYRKMGATGEEIWCELRPTPNAVQSYKILYQAGDWWSSAFELGGINYNLPNKEYRFYFRALAARLLLPKARWAYGDDSARLAMVKEALDRRIAKGEKALNDHLASLDNADITSLLSWADENDPYIFPLRWR